MWQTRLFGKIRVKFDLVLLCRFIHDFCNLLIFKFAIFLSDHYNKSGNGSEVYIKQLVEQTCGGAHKNFDVLLRPQVKQG